MSTEDELEAVNEEATQYATTIMEMCKALQPIADFVDAWEAKPLNGLDDAFYNIHTGTEWEASLRLSDLKKIRDLIR